MTSARRRRRGSRQQPHSGRRHREVRLLAALGFVAAGAATWWAVAAVAGVAGLEPRTLAQARVIRAEVDARYRRPPGRGLAVTEVSSTSVVASLTLVEPLALPRVVPADNGIYFAVCPVGATCPNPVRAASVPAAAFLPRRLALELALRTFAETSATLVVVALPTARPVWIVFERLEVLAEVELLDAVATRALRREVVDRVTRPRVFAPLAIVPLSEGEETILAVRL